MFALSCSGCRARVFAIALPVGVLLCGAVPGYAAFEHLSCGAEPAGMAGAYVGYARGPEAILINPAGVAAAVRPAGLVSYSRPFGLKELDASGISAHLPLRVGGVAVAARLFGRAPYQEQAFSAGAGFIVTPRLYVGAAAHLFHLRIASYGAASALGIDLGLLTAVSPTIHWGVSVRNLNRPRIGECREPLPQVLATGVCITPVMPLAVTFDVEKDVRYPAELRLGTAYRPLPPLVVRCGLQSNPGRFAAGFGLWVGLVRIDYAASYHYDLGITHSMSLRIGME
ncbi:MAG: hypothetical protein ONB30_06995 [candidate division KSB1 bacterium]|nr:hypothetical protein [candidate division KSB1 bacterium]